MSSKDHCHKALEKAFESTLTEELIPGILHNFANPLNGIMGRSKLLQRKLEANAGEMTDRAQAEALYGKLFRDVELIGRDTDKLTALLRQVAEKFYTISKTSAQRVNLSELIGVEMSFFDFYLDFKHNVKKNVDLSYDLPEITGVPAELSLGLWALLRQTMLRLNASDRKGSFELHISTEHGDGQIRLYIANTGACLCHNEWALISQLLQRDSLEGIEMNSDAMLLHALFLLKKYGAEFRMEDSDGLHSLTILIPTV